MRVVQVDAGGVAQSAVEFFEQVNNLNHVTEFVCAMKNEDVARGK